MNATFSLLAILLVTQLAVLGFPTQVGKAFAELQIAETAESFPLNVTSQTIEIRITSEQAFQPLAVMMLLNSTSQSSNFSIRDIVVYDDQFNSYPMELSQSVLPANSTAAMLHQDLLPSAVPAGGAVALVVEISDSQIATLDVTAIVLADSQVPIALHIGSDGELPLDVLENSRIEVRGNSSEDVIRIDNGFADPEIHCETCTRVEFRPNSSEPIEVSFVRNDTDVSKAQTMTFWAMGEGEVTFSAAGRNNDNGTVSYAESVALSLDDQWRRTDLDISESDLDDITHLFGFSLAGTEEQTFYIKGAMFS